MTELQMIQNRHGRNCYLQHHECAVAYVEALQVEVTHLNRQVEDGKTLFEVAQQAVATLSGIIRRVKVENRALRT